MKNISILKKLSIPMVLCTAMTGCATGYHSSTNPLLGWMGGFWDKPAPGELVEVGFAGNGFTDRDRAGMYLLYRCAELTRDRNKTHFTIYGSLYEAIVERPASESFVGSIGFKPIAHVYLLTQDGETITRANGEVIHTFSVNDVLEKYKDQIKVI